MWWTLLILAARWGVSELLRRALASENLPTENTKGKETLQDTAVNAIAQLYNDYCPPFNYSNFREMVIDEMDRQAKDYLLKRRIAFVMPKREALAFVWERVVESGNLLVREYRGMGDESFVDLVGRRLMEDYDLTTGLFEKEQTPDRIFLEKIILSMKKWEEFWEQRAACRVLRSIGEKCPYATKADSSLSMDRRLSFKVAIRDDSSLDLTGFPFTFDLVGRTGKIIRTVTLTEQQKQDSTWSGYPPGTARQFHTVTLPYGLRPWGIVVRVVGMDPPDSSWNYGRFEYLPGYDGEVWALVNVTSSNLVEPGDIGEFEAWNEPEP